MIISHAPEMRGKRTQSLQSGIVQYRRRRVSRLFSTAFSQNTINNMHATVGRNWDTLIFIIIYSEDGMPYCIERTCIHPRAFRGSSDTALSQDKDREDDNAAHFTLCTSGNSSDTNERQLSRRLSSSVVHTRSRLKASRDGGHYEKGSPSLLPRHSRILEIFH
jgi:hypothetical protein